MPPYLLLLSLLSLLLPPSFSFSSSLSSFSSLEQVKHICAKDYNKKY